MSTPLDPSEHNRRVAAATHILSAAVAEHEDHVQDLLAQLCLGDGDREHEHERLATAVYVWVGAVLHAGHILGMTDLRAELPPMADPHSPDHIPGLEAPASVRAASHVYNLGLSRQWRTVGEVLGAAAAADHLYETVAQVLWICANLLRRLGAAHTIGH